MRWALPSAYTIQQDEEEEVKVEEPPVQRDSGKGKRRPVARPAAPRRSGLNLPNVPATVMTDMLTFFCFVFLYTTNAQQLSNPLAILFSSIFPRNEGGQIVSSPAIFFLM